VAALSRRALGVGFSRRLQSTTAYIGRSVNGTYLNGNFASLNVFSENLPIMDIALIAVPPTGSPTGQPSGQPSSKPSAQPSRQPTLSPTTLLPPSPHPTPANLTVASLASDITKEVWFPGTLSGLLLFCCCMGGLGYGYTRSKKWWKKDSSKASSKNDPTSRPRTADFDFEAHGISTGGVDGGGPSPHSLSELEDSARCESKLEQKRPLGLFGSLSMMTSAKKKPVHKAVFKPHPLLLPTLQLVMENPPPPSPAREVALSLENRAEGYSPSPSPSSSSSSSVDSEDDDETGFHDAPSDSVHSAHPPPPPPSPPPPEVISSLRAAGAPRPFEQNFSSAGHDPSGPPRDPRIFSVSESTRPTLKDHQPPPPPSWM